MDQNSEQVWRRYFNVSSPMPITEINPNISDANNAFVYKSFFTDLSNYAIYFENKDDYYILFEQNGFSNGKGTIVVNRNSSKVTPQKS